MYATYPIVALLQGFEWFDESLQRGLKAKGWPVLTRPESAVMIHVCLGMTRPSDIARRLGLTRQAIHSTINQIAKKGLFRFDDDPKDRRVRSIVLTPMGQAMREDANALVTSFAERLSEIIGKRRYDNLIEALSADWGESLGEDSGASVKRRSRPAPIR